MNVGTDIIEIQRVKDLIQKNGNLLIGKLFTKNEWEYCINQSNNYASFAARIAAKEAISKVFKTGFCEKFSWISAEICINDAGDPYCKLDNLGKNLMQKFSAKNIDISISHCKIYAIAVACLC